MTAIILLIGAADTGRAPMAVAILRRMLAMHRPDYAIASAGVVGHDGDPAEPEARDALTTLGLDIQEHRARSLTDDIVATATLLICVDSGIARVVRTRYPHTSVPIVTLGELAGRPRDLPDPFRMQIGAWIGYAHEIEGLLRNGMQRLIALAQGEPVINAQTRPTSSAHASSTATHATASAHASATSTGTTHTFATSTTTPSATGEPRHAAIARCEQLLALLHSMPHIIAWETARHQLEVELHTIKHTPYTPTELIQPYIAMVLTMIGTSTSLPSPGQIDLLRMTISRLDHSVDAQAITTLSNQIIHWGKIN